MIIVRLLGGLGNQMFEYALGKRLALERETRLKLDTFFLHDHSKKLFEVHRNYDLDIFNVSPAIAARQEIELFDIDFGTRSKISRIMKENKKAKSTRTGEFKILYEPSFNYCPEALDYQRNTYAIGYWQSEKYFKEIEEEIREDFTFKNKPEGEALEMLKRIQAAKNPVCVNVRRGYIHNLKERLYHGFLGKKYYKDAERIVANNIKNPHYFVFSDEIEWCEDNLNFDAPTTYVGHNCAGEKFQYYLQLMIECRHFIIPNSTFGWWAAWLNGYQQKIVIAPKKWFKFPIHDTSDLIPNNWLRI